MLIVFFFGWHEWHMNFTRAGLADHHAEFIHEHRWGSQPLDDWIVSLPMLAKRLP